MSLKNQPVKTRAHGQSLNDADFESVWIYRSERLRLAMVRTLAKRREHMALPQKELASRMKISPSLVSRFLSGRDSASPTLETLVKYATGLESYLDIRFIENPKPDETRLSKREEPRPPKAEHTNRPPESGFKFLYPPEQTYVFDVSSRPDGSARPKARN